MKKIIHQFTETGEVRKITDGEFYFRMGDCKSWCDYEPSKDKYRVLTYERIEEEWKLKENDIYFYIDLAHNIVLETFFNNLEGLDEERFKIGNCFPTKELAESKLKQIKDILKGVTQ